MPTFQHILETWQAQLCRLMDKTPHSSTPYCHLVRVPYPLNSAWNTLTQMKKPTPDQWTQLHERLNSCKGVMILLGTNQRLEVSRLSENKLRARASHLCIHPDVQTLAQQWCIHAQKISYWTLYTMLMAHVPSTFKYTTVNSKWVKTFKTIFNETVLNTDESPCCWGFWYISKLLEGCHQWCSGNSTSMVQVSPVSQASTAADNVGF